MKEVRVTRPVIVVSNEILSAAAGLISLGLKKAHLRTLFHGRKPTQEVVAVWDCVAKSIEIPEFPYAEVWHRAFCYYIASFVEPTNAGKKNLSLVSANHPLLQTQSKKPVHVAQVLGLQKKVLEKFLKLKQISNVAVMLRGTVLHRQNFVDFHLMPPSCQELVRRIVNQSSSGLSLLTRTAATQGFNLIWEFLQAVSSRKEAITSESKLVYELMVWVDERFGATKSIIFKDIPNFENGNSLLVTLVNRAIEAFAEPRTRLLFATWLGNFNPYGEADWGQLASKCGYNSPDTARSAFNRGLTKLRAWNKNCILDFVTSNLDSEPDISRQLAVDFAQRRFVIARKEDGKAVLVPTEKPDGNTVENFKIQAVMGREKFAQSTLAELGLPNKVALKLQQRGIKEGAHLLQIAEADLRAMNRIGPKTFDIVKTMVESFGFKLGSSPVQ